eukprot:CAMPEP_0198317678 /NCGR_PEP_ID=MMETSP1450-20131203/7124_1 /TAXON_ID=753684 ORGANISM="Madagascaria erythrocladiodes, Strain CCMP3234" /NCGR_SAMPLE_ID=MMETSP1450 /ASSEMBLY_ACC=CAM_ASM_001115 /LENGTH=86 /DNA_ID=CAMNT_0044020911 /DNA_START=234 /DNA_END=494 /DNA_ORIENTATION=+
MQLSPELYLMSATATTAALYELFAFCYDAADVALQRCERRMDVVRAAKLTQLPPPPLPPLPPSLFCDEALADEVLLLLSAASVRIV